METKTTITTTPAKKKSLNRLFSKMNAVLFAMMASVICLGINGGLVAFADGGDAGSFNSVVSFIVTWVQRIGGVIGFIGAIQFGMAFKNDDADGKTRGLMTLASGFIVIAICIAYDTLFKQA